MSQDLQTIDSESLYPPQPEGKPPSQLRRTVIRVAVVLVVGMLLVGGLTLGYGLWAYNADGSSVPTAIDLVNGQPPGWKLAFEEKFDDNANYWDETDETDTEGTLKPTLTGGVYRWKVSSVKEVTWTIQPVTKQVFGDAYISVDAQVTDSKPDDDVIYAIDFRRANADNDYWFGVTDSGSYYAGMFDEHNYTLQVPLRSTSQVRSHAVNTIGVLTVGSHFTFYINGQRVDELDAPTQTPGRFALGMYLPKGGYDATVVFDNLRVYTP